MSGFPGGPRPDFGASNIQEVTANRRMDEGEDGEDDESSVEDGEDRTKADEVAKRKTRRR